VRALPLSLAAQWGRPVGASFLRPLTLSLCLVGPVHQSSSRCSACPLFSLCTVDLPCQFRLLRARRGLARAHSRTSPDFSATTPAHAPSSLFRAPPVPHAHPSPHFTHPRPLSMTESPEFVQLKCLSHASRVVTHLNRNNLSVPQI
jgi:hypothetical protein